MSDLVKNFTTPYNRRARLVPGIIVILPLWIGIISWIPFDSAEWSGISAVGGTIVLGTLLAELIRDCGKKIESGLWKSWGGMPSALVLSFVHSPLNDVTLRRYHAVLKTRLPSLSLPKDISEEESSSSAMDAYASCSDYLRSVTRQDKEKFPLVFAENENYGLRRNLLGAKGWGVSFSMIGLVLAGSRVAGPWLPDRLNNLKLEFSDISIIYFMACFVILGVWIFIIKPNWVRTVAYEYAKRLAETCEKLET